MRSNKGMGCDGEGLGGFRSPCVHGQALGSLCAKWSAAIGQRGGCPEGPLADLGVHRPAE